MRGEDMDNVIETYSNMVYRLALARTQSRSDADDIYQEVFLRYLRKAPTFTDQEHQKAWLLRVTINCCKKLWRSAWNRKTVPLEDTLSCGPPEESALAEALAKLPEHYRIVIHLFYYEDLPVERIAEILGRGSSTVRTQLTRARRRLKELLREEP